MHRPDEAGEARASTSPAPRKRAGPLPHKASSCGDLPRLGTEHTPISTAKTLPNFDEAGDAGAPCAEAAPPQSLYEQLAKKRYAFFFGLVVGAAAVLYSAQKQVVYITHVTSVLDELRTRLPRNSLTANIVEQLQLLPDLRVPAFLGGEDPAAAAARCERPAGERPGKAAARQNLTALHPVVMIPGIVSTGLEMWQGHACASSYFRQRLWGTLSMIKLFVLDRDCWMRHMALNGVDGSDPPGIKVRPAQGFEAADYVVGGFWVWAVLIENLADVGYSPSNMWVGAFDWRLPYNMLEKRDQYFSRLRYHIEMFKSVHGHKVVVLAHSMGSTVWSYFQAWISSPEGGKLSAAWVHEHIEAVVLIGPSTLGTPKAITGLLMGESRDFTYLTGTLGALVDSVLSPRMRRRMMRAFPSTQTLLPMGGDAVWGDESGAPDDPPDVDGAAAEGARAGGRPAERPSGGSKASHGALLQRVTGSTASGRIATEPVKTASQAMVMIAADAARSQRADVARDSDADGGGDGDESSASAAPVPFAFRYAHGLSEPAELLRPREAAWINPLATALPYAPDLTVHCLYGVGVPTERSYVVTPTAGTGVCAADGDGGEREGEMCADARGARAECDDDAGARAARRADAGADSTPADQVPYLIDRSANDGGSLVKGVRLTDGDGTVPLLSLGYMCARGWRGDGRLYNPSGSRVVTREYRHVPGSGSVPTRGERSADHVDILGNSGVISDILRIVAGRGAELSDHIESDIVRISENVEQRISAAHKRAAAAHGGPGLAAGSRRRSAAAAPTDSGSARAIAAKGASDDGARSSPHGGADGPAACVGDGCAARLPVPVAPVG